MQLELFARNRKAQLILELAAAIHGRQHLGFEQAEAVSAGFLDRVEREIGHLEQIRAVVGVFRSQRDADAATYGDHVAIEIVGLRNKLNDAGGQTGCALAWLFLARLNDGKFIAAQTGEHVGFTQRGLQPLRGLPEQFISGRMAQRVVDVLELVEIHHEHTEGLAVALQAGDGALELLGEIGPVRQAGQYIVVCKKANMAVGLVTLGDIFMS